MKNLSEGEIAHFEASLTPVGDETMVVEWFYNGKALEASKLHVLRTIVTHLYILPLEGLLDISETHLVALFQFQY